MSHFQNWRSLCTIQRLNPVCNPRFLLTVGHDWLGTICDHGHLDLPLCRHGNFDHVDWPPPSCTEQLPSDLQHGAEASHTRDHIGSPGGAWLQHNDAITVNSAFWLQTAAVNLTAVWGCGSQHDQQPRSFGGGKHLRCSHTANVFRWMTDMHCAEGNPMFDSAAQLQSMGFNSTCTGI